MFHKCKSSDEVKALYRRLAMLLHPDKGGDNALMTLLTECYEKTFDQFKKVEEQITDLEKGKYRPVFDDILINDPRIDIIKDMWLYSEKHPKFNTAFLESISDYLENKGYITKAQYNSLIKTYYSFRMYED